METTEQDRTAKVQLVALSLVMIAVCIAGGVAVTSWIALAVEHAQLATLTESRTPSCRVCGVVEEVRELDLPRHASVSIAGGMSGAPSLAGADAGGVIALLAILNGTGARRATEAPVRVYEVTVRLEDGTYRSLRDTVAPTWRVGDKVRVMRGRIEAVS